LKTCYYFRMKYLFVLLIFICQNSFGQKDSAIIIVDLGWSIKMPSDYIIIDTAMRNAENKSMTWFKKPPPPPKSYHDILYVRNQSGNIFSISALDLSDDSLKGNFESFSKNDPGKSVQSNENYGGIQFNKLTTIFEIPSNAQDSKKPPIPPGVIVSPVHLENNKMIYIITLKTIYKDKVFTVSTAIQILL
jgi:hypothetical protein